MTTKKGKWLQEHPCHDHTLPPSDECRANPQAVRLLCFCVDFFPSRWGVDSCSRASGIMWQPFMNVYGQRVATKTQTTNTEVVIQRCTEQPMRTGRPGRKWSRNGIFISGSSVRPETVHLFAWGQRSEPWCEIVPSSERAALVTSPACWLVKSQRAQTTVVITDANLFTIDRNCSLFWNL